MKEKEMRNINLDLLRLVACIAVIGLHTVPKELSMATSSFYYLCGFHVQIFFMCSGYILMNRQTLDFRYIVYKLVSIFRLVFVWNILFGVVEIIQNFYTAEFDVWGGLIKILKSLVKGVLQTGRFWHFWYFGALALIYLMAPALQRLSRNFGKEKIWAAIMICCAFVQALSDLLGMPLQKNVKQMFRLWTWVQYFLLGGLLIDYKKKSSLVPVLVLSAVVIALENFAGRHILHNLFAEYFYDDVCVILWCAAIFVWIMGLKLPERCQSVIQRLAPLTLGVYIIHPLFIRYIGSKLEIRTTMVSLVYFAGVTVVCFGIVFLIKKIGLSCLVVMK